MNYQSFILLESCSQVHDATKCYNTQSDIREIHYRYIGVVIVYLTNHYLHPHVEDGPLN